MLLCVQDAFSGLAAVTAGMFPQCTVHMLHNAQEHLGKQDFRIFRSDWQGVRSACDPELGAQRFEARYGTWIGDLRRLLAFVGYPSCVRAFLATTNTSEAVNRQLEVPHRNSGGWFQSKRSLECRLAPAVRRLHRGRWKSPDRRVCAALPALFRQRFEPAGTDWPAAVGRKRFRILGRGLTPPPRPRPPDPCAASLSASSAHPVVLCLLAGRQPRLSPPAAASRRPARSPPCRDRDTTLQHRNLK